MINTWEDFLKQEQQKDYYKALAAFISNERDRYIIYPKDEEIFNAFKLCPLDKVKCVFLAMDPYINPNQAHGLAFSVLQGPNPPSLKNIFKELKNDLGIENTNGNLESWAKQGVLLLNASLTVQAGKSGSHKGKWELLTDEAIKILNLREQPIVFALWGNDARAKKIWITNEKHKVLQCPHPSPFSANSGFLGSKHFSQINEFLKQNNIEEINWKT